VKNKKINKPNKTKKTKKNKYNQNKSRVYEAFQRLLQDHQPARIDEVVEWFDHLWNGGFIYKSSDDAPIGAEMKVEVKEGSARTDQRVAAMKFINENKDSNKLKYIPPITFGEYQQVSDLQSLIILKGEVVPTALHNLVINANCLVICR
jgi:hypothetical protein